MFRVPDFSGLLCVAQYRFLEPICLSVIEAPMTSRPLVSLSLQDDTDAKVQGAPASAMRTRSHVAKLIANGLMPGEGGEAGGRAEDRRAFQRCGQERAARKTRAESVEQVASGAL